MVCSVSENSLCILLAFQSLKNTKFLSFFRVKGDSWLFLPLIAVVVSRWLLPFWQKERIPKACSSLFEKCFEQGSVKPLNLPLLGAPATYNWQAGLSEALEAVRGGFWQHDRGVLAWWALRRFVCSWIYYFFLKWWNMSSRIDMLCAIVSFRSGEDLRADQHSDSVWAEVWPRHWLRKNLRRIRQL